MRLKLLLPLLALFATGSLMANMTPPKKAAKKFAVAWSPQYAFKIARATHKFTNLIGVTTTNETDFQQVSGGADLSFSFVVADRFAIILPIYARVATSFTDYTFPEEINRVSVSIGTGVGARFFLSNSAYESGLYFDTMTKIGYFADFVRVATDKFEKVGNGGLEASGQLALGYAIVLDSGFMLDFRGGVEGSVSYAKQENPFLGQAETVNLGVAPVAGISLGYAW